MVPFTLVTAKFREFVHIYERNQKCLVVRVYTHTVYMCIVLVMYSLCLLRVCVCVCAQIYTCPQICAVYVFFLPVYLGMQPKICISYMTGRRAQHITRFNRNQFISPANTWERQSKPTKSHQEREQNRK